jgi:hypothetical protein
MNSTTVIILVLIAVLIMHLVEEVKTGFRQVFEDMIRKEKEVEK